ncbi:MAG: Mth938-like domain-containing protein [Candidatus Bathyarchaeia archaeon]
MIDSYDFGVIIVNGKRYTSDVIVFPEMVFDSWWRREGHKICLEDLKEVLNREPKPGTLVIGTGYYGIVKILPEVENALKSQGITLIAQPTKEACQTFNKLLKSKKHVVGAFHLTC